VPPATRSPSSAARVLYAGVIASTLIISVGALATSITLGTATPVTGWPDWVALVVGSGSFVAGMQRRKGLNRPAGGQTADQWWGENAGRVLTIWGLLEFAAIAGALVVFATGHLTVFVALAVLALAALLTLTPGRVAG
jgi:hypothetical protein